MWFANAKAALCTATTNQLTGTLSASAVLAASGRPFHAALASALQGWGAAPRTSGGRGAGALPIRESGYAEKSRRFFSQKALLARRARFERACFTAPLSPVRPPFLFARYVRTSSIVLLVKLD